MVNWRDVITGVIAALLTTVALWLFGVIQHISVSVTIPSQAVVAFDSNDCPEGWDKIPRADGRVIVGAGQGEKTLFQPNDRGGHETVTLEFANLPPHSHKITAYRWYLYNQGNKTAWADDNIDGSGQNAKTVDTTSVGSSKEVEIMPPWISYRLCKKK